MPQRKPDIRDLEMTAALVLRELRRPDEVRASELLLKSLLAEHAFMWRG